MDQTAPAPVTSEGKETTVNKFSRHSFRAKFMLVVGAAVVFDLMMGGGIAIWNVQRLSKDATRQVSAGLTSTMEDYLRTYIETTALRTNLLLDQTFSEVEALGASMQTLIDHPETERKIGRVVEEDQDLGDNLLYNPDGNWSQNPSGPSVVSIWGYLLDDEGNPLPDVQEQIENSSTFNLVAPGLMTSGSPKLQMYYVGPKDKPIMRTTPHTEQAQTFDKLYPGHNEANFWDFFFPGVYEGWQSWIADPSNRPVNRNIVGTEPYVDAITGALIVSFFEPLWTEDRSDVAGMVAVDVTLDQFASLVENVQIADTGFGFLTSSGGNVIATSEIGAQELGLVAEDATGQGVTGVNRYLSDSKYSSIANLAMPVNTDTIIDRITIEDGDRKESFLVILKQLEPMNLWNGTGIQSERLTLGFMVSEDEVYALLTTIQNEISEATERIVYWQIAALMVALVIVFIAVYAVSGRITAGLSKLANAAQALENKDYSVRVAIPSRDEVGAVGLAFNRMAAEISYHTENLEKLVDERTAKLESANKEIVALNQRLKDENLRLGAELDVAKRIQEMVLPRRSELEGISQVEIAAYMEPADEVGGDYYDVLHDGGRIKVGIGDVTGHGLESGVLMLMVQSVARALQEKGDRDPIAFLGVLNRALYKNIERTNSDKHMTLAFVDYEDGKVTLSGQHEEVLIIRANGDVERIDTVDLGFPVGLEADITPFVQTLDLGFSKNDILILHTDGVTEAETPGGELYGFDRMCDCAKANIDKPAKGIAEAIIRDVKEHIDTQKMFDDITLVVMKHR
ncbi:HAMP domain-containing protein [Roseibium denhamense]|uniref:Sigma-B regulation protein RsbU (Phosphoserine phosphatase) n=1 Tax=Roseibium denhamense TaxID=76305 RepID=A0ABY1NY38_9HYPH|nr:SpoIIE family protein phosphatase [Roseibium denhamense]MTI04877.1 HAMP domain-containing protein [Roseibium denhamense]SMP20550.1 sigma-B regulation protein RsbU (phosphoserine phosphatase) [Roseibium denhamense]